MTDLAGRVALVTGAGRGIGRATALALAGAGADLVLTALEADELDRVAAEIDRVGRSTLSRAADVADAVAVEELKAESLDRFGRIDILVNNAGTLMLPGHLAGTTPDMWDRTMTVNARAAST